MFKGKLCPRCGNIFADALVVDPDLGRKLGNNRDGQERVMVPRSGEDKSLCAQCVAYLKSPEGIHEAKAARIGDAPAPTFPR